MLLTRRRVRLRLPGDGEATDRDETPVMAKILSRLAATAAIGLLAIVSLGWLFPGAAAPPVTAASASQPSLVLPAGADQPYTLVPASQGVSVAGEEPPLLEPLVDSGILPPLIERLPSEPLVFHGVDGPAAGEYGGTWQRLAVSINDVESTIVNRLSYAAPVRWSPMGEPIVEHVARSMTPAEGGRIWTFELREGHRWSDGEPFTTADVAYWWDEEIQHELLGGGDVPWWLLNGAEVPRLEVQSPTIFRLVYDTPNGLLKELVASFGMHMFNSPEHFRRPFHPEHGDPELIEQERRAFDVPSGRALYAHRNDHLNPEHPRLWPWVPRSYDSNPPVTFVRNPYYFAVDGAGRQLPYIDRLQFAIRRADLIPLDVAAGHVGMQMRGLRFADFTEYATRGDAVGFDVKLWKPGSRGDFVLYPNVTRRAAVEDADVSLEGEDFGRADLPPSSVAGDQPPGDHPRDAQGPDRAVAVGPRRRLRFPRRGACTAIHGLRPGAGRGVAGRAGLETVGSGKACGRSRTARR